MNGRVSKEISRDLKTQSKRIRKVFAAAPALSLWQKIKTAVRRGWHWLCCRPDRIPAGMNPKRRYIRQIKRTYKGLKSGRIKD